MGDEAQRAHAPEVGVGEVEALARELIRRGLDDFHARVGEQQAQQLASRVARGSEDGHARHGCTPAA